MMSAINLPVTLATTSVLCLLALVLAARVISARYAHRASIGDGGHPEVTMRMRTHANFSEYVPILLILMALIEAAGGNRIALIVSGGVLIVARVLHAVGMPRPAPNFFRAAGAILTFLLLLSGAAYGLVLAWFQSNPST